MVALLSFTEQIIICYFEPMFVSKHMANEFRKMEIHTAKRMILEPSPFGAEITIEKVNRYKSSGIDQTLAEVIQVKY
jgi:hypothetical protein